MEVIEHAPYLAAFKSGVFVGKSVFTHVFKKFAENVVECDKVQEIGRILLISCRDAIDYFFGNILQALLVVPNFIEFAYIISAVFSRCCFHYCGKHIVSALASEIDRSKTIQRRIAYVINIHKAHKVLSRNVGFERSLASDPIGTFTSDGTLRKFISQFNFELGSIDTFFSLKARDIKLTAFLSYLFCDKSRGRENEPQLVNTFKLGFQFLICVYREERCGNCYFTAAFNGFA